MHVGKERTPGGPANWWGRCAARPAAAILCLVSALASGCADDRLCNIGEVRDRLAAAEPDATVTLGACQIEGAITVPAGVHVVGQSAATVLRTPGDQPVVTLESADGRTTSIAGVTIQSHRSVGIVGSGDGRISIADATVQSSRGVGMRFEGLSRLELRDVAVTGPVTAGNAMTVPTDPTGAETATHGILLRGVGRGAEAATLAGVSVRGFARFGVLAIDSTVTLSDSDLSRNLGTGFMAMGGAVILARVTICESFRGRQPHPAYGAVFAAGAVVHSEDLEVCSGEGIGLLHDDASGDHQRAFVHGQAEVGLWVQHTEGLEIAGSSTLFEENYIGGIVVRDARRVAIRDARIRTTRSGPFRWGETDEIHVGDGIQLLIDDGAAIELRGLTLTGHDRAALLLEYGKGFPSVLSITDVTVDARGGTFGAIAQTADGPLMSGAWDRRIDRMGAAAANDGNLVDRLEVLGAIPATHLPQE